jgi:hypothetical protein
MLELQDKRRQYIEHVNAIRSKKAAIDCKRPPAPGRIEFHRKRHYWLQKALIKTGEDNLRLIAMYNEQKKLKDGRNKIASSKGVTVPLIQEKVDWVSMLTGHSNRSASSVRSESGFPAGVRAKLKPLPEPPEETKKTEEQHESGGQERDVKGEGNQEPDKNPSDRKYTDTSLGNSGNEARLDALLSAEDPV